MVTMWKVHHDWMKISKKDPWMLVKPPPGKPWDPARSPFLDIIRVTCFLFRGLEGVAVLLVCKPIYYYV